MTLARTFEAFSLTHAAILADGTGLEALNGDLYGVRQASITVDVGNFDNTGDDQVLSPWFWINYATLNIQGGYIDFDTLAYISGTSVTASGTGPTDYYSVPLWNENCVVQSAKPVLIRMRSKNAATTPRIYEILLYQCTFGPLQFEGPQYKQGLTVSWTARAVLSQTDELGNTLAEKTIGRLINSWVA